MSTARVDARVSVEVPLALVIGAGARKAVVLAIEGGHVIAFARARNAERRVLEIDDPVEFTLAFPACRRPITDPDRRLLASRFRPV